MSETEREVLHLATLVHGRTLLRRPADGEPVGLLVGFHGYGEDAAAHLAELERIPGSGEWLLAAVQALHPFYTRGGEVVASWMTRQDRELAIDDNVRYTASAVAHLKRRWPELHRLVYAGFSQGVAMAYRAAAGSGHPCHGLLALAGDVPPEVAARPLPAFPPVLIGRGRSDGWYDEAKMRRDLEVLKQRGIEARACVFEGGHEWGEAYLAEAGELLAAVAARPPDHHS